MAIVLVVLIVYRRVHVVVVQLEPATATVQNKFNNSKSNKKTQNYFNNIYIYYRQDKKCRVLVVLFLSFLNKNKSIMCVCTL